MYDQQNSYSNFILLTCLILSFKHQPCQEQDILLVFIRYNEFDIQPFDLNVSNIYLSLTVLWSQIDFIKNSVRQDIYETLFWHWSITFIKILSCNALNHDPQREIIDGLLWLKHCLPPLKRILNKRFKGLKKIHCSFLT